MILAIAAAVGFGACGGSVSKPAMSEEEVTALLEAGDLPVPEVPESLVSPQDRAEFVALHFWDAMDWQQHALSLDTVFVEQNFANYLGILPYANPDGREKAVALLLQSAASDKEAYTYLASVAERYLADPNSPMRSEDIYIIFLKEFLKSPMFGEEKKSKYEYQLGNAQKNRPGMLAADFAMRSREGKQLSLLQSAAGADYTLLLFYDPDCEHCKEILGNISEWEMPGGVQVMAVDVTGDAVRFERTKGNYPPAWEVAFATDPIEDAELYNFPALPSIYMLDRDGNVVLKDAGVQTLTMVLGRM